MREKLTTAAEVVGMAMVAVGFGMCWLPLGLIAGGAALIAIGWAEGRS